MPVATRDDETAKFGRGRVIGMSFELGAESKNLGALQRVIEEGVQSVEHAEPDRDAAPESARARHFAFDRARKLERFAIRCRKNLRAACRAIPPASISLARATVTKL